MAEVHPEWPTRLAHAPARQGDGGGPAAGRPAHPPAGHRRERGPRRLRQHHLREGRGGDRHVRALGRPRQVPRRRAALPRRARVGQRDRPTISSRRSAAPTKRWCPRFRGFVDRPGVPLLDVALDCSGKPALKLAQRRLLPPGAPADETRWTFPACFDIGDGKAHDHRMHGGARGAADAAAAGAACPQWVVANRSGSGYFLPRLTPALYAALPKAERSLTRNDDGRAAGRPRAARPHRRRGPARPAAAGGAACGESRRARRAPRLRSRGRGAGRDARRGACALATPRTCARNSASARARWLAAEGRRVAGRAAAARDGGAVRRRARRRRGAGAQGAAARPALARASQRDSAGRPAHGAGGRRARRPARRRRCCSTRCVAVAREGRDVNEREDAIVALGSLPRSRAARPRARAAARSAGADNRDVSLLLERRSRTRRTRPAALAWLAANVDALMARVPPEQHSGWILRRAVPARARARAVRGAVRRRATGMEAGPRRYARTLERIDLCLALRQRAAGAARRVPDRRRNDARTCATSRPPRSS